MATVGGELVFGRVFPKEGKLLAVDLDALEKRLFEVQKQIEEVGGLAPDGCGNPECTGCDGDNYVMDELEPAIEELDNLRGELRLYVARSK